MSFPRGPFPLTRMRRPRAQDFSRRLIRETTLCSDDLIWPLFVCEGSGQRQPIATMPGIERLSVDLLPEAADQAMQLGIPAVALFPCTDSALRDDVASEALNPENLICRAVRAVKSAAPELGTIGDVALDPYTSHGHDGILKGDQICNDQTLDILAAQAVIQAKAGFDIIAPSDMMDGRIGHIRKQLDSQGLTGTMIASYAVKYASAFYGPFRNAIGSDGTLKGDKKTYQMDPANTDEALHEVALDLSEGADMIMVKPGLPCLDIIYRIKQTFRVPVFGYQVSGEYAGICAAAEAGSLDRNDAMLESFTALKRAGADAVITYFAPELAKIING